MIDFRRFQNMVYDYAQTREFLGNVDLRSPLVMDFIMLMAENRMIPEHREISIEQTMREREVQFLDWFLLEREFHDGKTIGELYIDSESFERDFGLAATADLRRIVQTLREPIWNDFTVVGKQEKDRYWVEQFDTDNAFLVHDKSTFVRFEVGATFYSKLIPFGGVYYLGTDPIIIPKERVEKYFKVKALLESLEERLEVFMEGKAGLAPKTRRKYEESIPLLLDFVDFKHYTKPSQVKDLDVDTMIKWASEEFWLSKWKEDQYRSAIKHIVRYLSKIENWE